MKLIYFYLIIKYIKIYSIKIIFCLYIKVIKVLQNNFKLYSYKYYYFTIKN